MAFAETDDGVKLYFEETGRGEPVIFVHEFAGDHRSWELQVRHFARRYRCITTNARGYPPSDVPEDPGRYSQARATADVKAVLDHLGIARAHIVGLSMGGFATLHFGLRYPEQARALVVAGCGYGAEPDAREKFRAEAKACADSLARDGMAAFAAGYSLGPARVQFQNKDPRGHREFAEMLAGHSATGAALTQLGVQRERPSLYDLEDQLGALTVPTLIVTGDEDEPCLAPSLYMKRKIPSAGLAVLPKTGHTLNLEEPEAFNRLLTEFFALVEAGRWEPRDPRSISDTILGSYRLGSKRSKT